MKTARLGTLLCVVGVAAATGALASSHREAPFLTHHPKVDATDFYAFSSYQTGRAGFVTLIANYQPIQAPWGGPNYYSLDPSALYEIHIDNTGDGVEDITFQFDFSLALASSGTGLRLTVGPPGNQRSVAVPVANVGPVSFASEADRNVLQTYTLKVIRGPRRTGAVASVTGTGGDIFRVPLDNVGSKSIANYAAYANAHVFDVTIPGCAATGARVFVGQRSESFAANLGQLMDLLNLDLDVGTPQANPLGQMDQGANVLGSSNVTSLALEVPTSCLVTASSTIIGAWTTASLPQVRVLNPTAGFTTPAREGGEWTQVSRLGMPLVNELVIGVTDKDRFNASSPADDAQFLDYVTHPSLPEIVELFFGAAGVQAPNNFPRADLVAAFLTGVSGVNANGSTAEMLRLNTALPATPSSMQEPLGAMLCFTRTATGAVVNLANPGCDVAGFPNGRRPGDDVVDITLRVSMGFLAPTASAPSGSLPFVDGAFAGPTSFQSVFPYLNTPRPGAP